MLIKVYSFSETYLPCHPVNYLIKYVSKIVPLYEAKKEVSEYLLNLKVWPHFLEI